MIARMRVCVCQGGPLTHRNTTLISYISLTPLYPQRLKVPPQLKSSSRQPRRLAHHPLFFFIFSGDTVQWEAQVCVRPTSFSTGPRLTWRLQEGERSVIVYLGFWEYMCCAKLLQLCPTLCDVMTASFLVHGIPQARILEWVATSFSRGSSPPRDWTHISYISCTGR